MEEELDIITNVQDTLQRLSDVVNEGHVVGIQAQIFLDDGRVIVTWPGEPTTQLEALGALELAKHTMLHAIDDEDSGGAEIPW